MSAGTDFFVDSVKRNRGSYIAFAHCLASAKATDLVALWMEPSDFPPALRKLFQWIIAWEDDSDQRVISFEAHVASIDYRELRALHWAMEIESFILGRWPIERVVQQFKRRRARLTNPIDTAAAAIVARPRNAVDAGLHVVRDLLDAGVQEKDLLRWLRAWSATQDRVLSADELRAFLDRGLRQLRQEDAA